MATLIMVVRHGEKPGEPPPPNGVDSQGVVDEKCLIPRGWQRSGALACLFSTWGVATRPGLAVPTVVYATNPDSESKRPKETVEAVSELQLNGAKPNLGFNEGQEKELAAAAKAGAGPVLIGWHHGHIPKLANEILGNDTTAPQEWPKDRFDMVWVFTLASGVWTFSQVPQMVLYGDSDQPFPPATKKQKDDATAAAAG